jgi:hypothetical protein
MAVMATESHVRVVTRGVHFIDANNLCRCTARPKLGGAGMPNYSKQNVISNCRLS